MLFRADTEQTAPNELNARTLKADLDGISNDLMVDMTLGMIV